MHKSGAQVVIKVDMRVIVIIVRLIVNMCMYEIMGVAMIMVMVIA